MAKSKWKNKERKEDFCRQIKEWQSDPQFIRAAREFIRVTTS